MMATRSFLKCMTNSKVDKSDQYNPAHSLPVERAVVGGGGRLMLW